MRSSNISDPKPSQIAPNQNQSKKLELKSPVDNRQG